MLISRISHGAEEPPQTDHLPGLKFSLKLLDFGAGFGAQFDGAFSAGNELLTVGAGVLLILVVGAVSPDIMPAPPPPKPYPFGPKFLP